MKFITEEDLRELYKKEPFTKYEIEPGARLTPGARQYLSDRGINMFDDDSFVKKFNFSGSEEAAAVVVTETVEPEAKINWKDKRLFSIMKSIEASFLLTEEELLRKDVCLAQSVVDLRKQFSCIKNAVKSNGNVDNLCCKECTGINQDNFSESLEDCFEITEFHVQLEKGKEIIVLHKLRCALQEIEPIVHELYESSNDENTKGEAIVRKINQISNSLSQLICLAFGGKKCQRKS